MVLISVLLSVVENVSWYDVSMCGDVMVVMNWFYDSVVVFRNVVVSGISIMRFK